MQPNSSDATETELLLDKAVDLYVFSPNPKAALPLIDRALGMDPHNRNAMRLKGHVLYALDREREAEAAYRELLESHPGDLDAYDGLGGILRDREEFEGAMEYYRLGLSGLPKLGSHSDDTDEAVLTAVILFDGMATCLEEVGCYDEAVDCLKDGCRLYSNSETMAIYLQRVLDQGAEERGSSQPA